MEQEFRLLRIQRLNKGIWDWQPEAGNPSAGSVAAGRTSRKPINLKSLNELGVKQMVNAALVIQGTFVVQIESQIMHYP